MKRLKTINNEGNRYVKQFDSIKCNSCEVMITKDTAEAFYGDCFNCAEVNGGIE